MPIIEIQRVPGLPKDRISVAAGTNFYEWLSEESLHSDVKIFINNKKLKDDDELNFRINEHDVIRIFDQPKGGLIGTILNPLEHLNPIKFTQKILDSIYKQPNANATLSNSKTSSNNSIKSQTNIARNGEARPDNYGQIRAFPDLIQQSLFEYNDNIKTVTEWMNFGLGTYSVTSVRYSESNINSLAGASYRIYNPGEVIPLINEGFIFDDINGQEVPGPNDSDTPIETATTDTVTEAAIVGNQLVVKIPENQDFNYFIDIAFPHSVTVILNVTYPTAGGNVTRNVTFSADIVSAETVNEDEENYYRFVFEKISGVDAVVLTEDTIINNTLFTLNDNESLVVGPSFSPVSGSEIWLHFQANLNGATADYSFTIRKVDANNTVIAGTEETFTGTITNPKSGSDTRYVTVKVTPRAGYGRYSVSIIKTNNSSNNSQLQIEAIHIVRQRVNVVYQNDTIVTVSVRDTNTATRARERKYNALITRHTISYDSEFQVVDYTLRPSRKIADAVIHTWLIMAKQSEDIIDIYGLYQIQHELESINPQLGYFDYTFDDEDASLGNRIETICDAGNITAFWDDGVLSFSLDKKQDNPVTVFNRSNMSASDYVLSCEMTLPGGYDGVEVQYRNPTTNKQAFIRYKIVNNAIAEGRPVKPKKFNMMYVRNTYQAQHRAIKELRRLIYSRLSMSIRALADGEWVNIGQMIQVVDTYDTNQQSGHITARNGNEFDTSERINFDGEMWVVITDSIGNPTERIRAYQRSDTDFGFTAAIPDIQLNIFDGYNVQSPSRYVIATVEELDSTKWTIVDRKTNTDSTTSLSLAEYSDKIHLGEL